MILDLQNIHYQLYTINIETFYVIDLRTVLLISVKRIVNTMRVRA